jgi:hypothetical protein
MKNKKLLAGLLSTCILVVTACGGVDESNTMVYPDLNAKTDMVDHVDMKGKLYFEDSVQGEFIDNFQFDAYTFRATADSPILIEVTQAGSSRGLDTTLFLFGPWNYEGYDQTPIAEDNDSGYGKLSKFEVTLPADGQYLVVVGTADAQGKGNYGLLLSCQQDKCSQDPPIEPDQCPTEIFNKLYECVDENYEDLSFADSYYTCTNHFNYLSFLVRLCANGSGGYDFCYDEDGDRIGPADMYNIYHEDCDQEILNGWADQLDVFSSCDEKVYSDMTDCIDDLIYSAEPLEAGDAIYECTAGDEKAQEYYQNICEQEDYPVWCLYDLQKFKDTIYGYCVEDTAYDY